MMMKNNKIPVYKPLLSGKEKEYVDECLESTWISSKGQYVSRFENEFSKYIGVEYGIAVTNGTVAIHLALLALGIGEGDEVIVPTLTYVATVNPVKYVGAVPIFVDSVEETWQMNPKDIESKITDKTKAIIVVHLYGHPCEMEEITRIARENNIFLIEDCAEAIGTKYAGRMVGSFGDIGCYSFFGNKTITTGEGGMIVTNDKTIASRAVNLKDQGLAMYREYWHDIVGYNFRMTNICAAIGVAQLEMVEEIIEKKRRIADWYEKYLEGLSCRLLRGKDEECGIRNTYWMCNIVLDNSEIREDLRNYLKDNGIETRPSFYPVHTMPIYSQKYQKFVVAEKLGWSGINMPSYPELSENDVMFICGKVREFMQSKPKC